MLSEFLSVPIELENLRFRPQLPQLIFRNVSLNVSKQNSINASYKHQIIFAISEHISDLDVFQPQDL